jgi:hypothetical protein
VALPAIIAGALSAAGSVGGAAAGGAAAGSAAGGMASAVGSLANVGAAVGAVGMVAQQAAPKIHMVGAAFHKATSTMAEALTIWVGVVKAAAGPVAELAAVHNPARVEAFTRALNDAYGVVGRLLTPVMDAFTRSARKVGDLMARMEPVIEPAMNAIAGLVENIFDQFVQTYEKNAPIFDMLATVIKNVAEAVSSAVTLIGKAIRLVLAPMQMLAAALGFGKTENPDASAVGAARRDARFVGPKQISDDAIKSSLMQGIGREKPPTEKHLENINKNIENIWKAVEKRWNVVKRAEAVANDPTLPARAAWNQVAGQDDATARHGMVEANKHRPR